MFTFNDNQRARLAAIRATLDEGERRFDFWSRREAQAAAAQAFGETLAESGLRAGRALTEAGTGQTAAGGGGTGSERQSVPASVRARPEGL